MENAEVLAKGNIERIGMDSAILNHSPVGKKELKQVSEILEHTTAIQKVLEVLVHPSYGVLQSINELLAVGHRVVHGGEEFTSSVVITEEVKVAITRTIDLAPLHNPPNLLGIQAVESILPHVPQVAVFDTAFHQTMPPEVYLYALPKILYNKYKVRRYGFHGTSHLYVSQRAAELTSKPIEALKIISCHIGNGVSLAAILHGRSLDTSMGMTPLEGLVMGTRSGDVDPAIVPFIMAKEDLTIGEVKSMLNKHSGLMGISGLSSDMREIEAAMFEGNQNASLAFEMFVYRIRKYIGAYTAAMNGLDILIFTAGVGENSGLVREKVCESLTFLGLEIDHDKNENNETKEHKISSEQSKVDVFVIPTNEELVIARDTVRLVNKSE